MPTIKGNLMLVSSRAAHASEVWVRAPKVRTHVEGVVTTGNDRFPVVDGEVSFTAVPGPAVLALISQGRPVDTVPILVNDEPTQSLETVILAAEVADDAQRDILERLAAQVAQDAEVARAQRVAAEDAASTATSAAGDASQSKDAAATSEMNAAQSETNAAASEQAAATSASNAATSEANAQDSATAAATSASEAEASEQAAATSASNAASSETNAQDSAAAAAGSATEAAAHADRAEQAADPTGLRDEITQQLADLVDGAPEDLDTIREVAEYAQENRDITDALNAAIGAKADATDASGRTVARYDPGSSQWLRVGDNPTLGGEYSNSAALNLRSADSRYASKASMQALTDGLAGKADVAVVNARPALFSGTGAPPSTIPNARVGDWWLNTSTMELHKITGV